MKYTYTLPTNAYKLAWNITVFWKIRTSLYRKQNAQIFNFI